MSQVTSHNVEFKAALGILAAVILSAGCANLKEAAKSFAGVSTQALEDGRKKAVRKTFNYDYETCFSRVKEILQNRGAYIYAQDKAKGMIAIYVSEIDTTAVGVFLKPGGANHTEIEVSSSSTYAKETIAGQIFNALERRAGLAEEKGMADAKKESLFE